MLVPEPERPLSPASTSVRPAPAAPDGLACSRFQKQFVIRLRGRQITSSTVELKDLIPLVRLWYILRRTPQEGFCRCKNSMQDEASDGYRRQIDFLFMIRA